MYKLRRILDHRAKKGGGIEYEVEWADKKINGEPWPNWWLPKKALTDDLIHGYESWSSHGVPRKEITIDVSLVYEEVRRKLANVMMNGAPTAAGNFSGPNRPRVHKLPMEQLSVLDVALGVLDLARKHGGPPIQLEHGNKGEPDEWWQLIISDLDRVAAFCNFQHFLDSVCTWENVRLTGTRKHSGDMMAVGVPIVLTVKKVRPGIASTFLEFPTVHFNGRTGRPTYPHMSSGALKREVTRRRLIKHVRDLLPERHPLRESGWCALPADISALAIEYVVPE